ncbi:MAG: hypothetical protein QY325_06175 [Flavobacteriales bacterium]|jgi:hypothetical protein|nr:MAG: hypothetical protein QY325_06175 [Flavobacteriales bacterium]
MKKTVLSFALLGICSLASAQLSTRENQDTRYKFGARPVAGDYALVFGLDLSKPEFAEGEREVSGWNAFMRGNLITGKKFIADDMAIRAGLRLTRSSRTIKAELDSNQFVPSSLAEFEFRESTREYMLVPGIEKHFSNSNIFDVYVAGDLFLGFGRDKSVESYIYRDTDFNSSITRTTPYTIVGLGGIIGVNVFVLDLPLSVGLEYGLSAFWQMGNRTKNEVESGSDSYEYYTVGNDPSSESGANVQYSSVKQRYMTMNSNDQVRLVLNLYFN